MNGLSWQPGPSYLHLVSKVPFLGTLITHWTPNTGTVGSPTPDCLVSWLSLGDELRLLPRGFRVQATLCDTSR